MLISEHIAFLQRQLAELGDVVIKKDDCEWGLDDFNHQPTEHRMVTIDGVAEVIHISDYQLAHMHVQQHSENYTALEDMIEEAKLLQNRADALIGDPEELMKNYMQGHRRDLAIVQAWHNSPPVLVL